MAKIIGIYNNKGGVGKTTLTLFFADFLSSISINKKKSRVLVIDFDAQGSCSNALLGLEQVNQLKLKGLTLPNFLLKKYFGDNSEDVGKYISTRKESTIGTRKTKLGNLDVIVSNADIAWDIEEKLQLKESFYFAKLIKEKLSEKYDFIFIDLPGNLSKRNTFSLIGAFLVDYFIVPVEPSRISINAIPLTLKMLENIEKWKDTGTFKLLGFMLNKADRRTMQYKLHKNEILQFAESARCKIYNNILPPTPKLSNASDDSIEYFTLSDRYDTYYKNVRDLVVEVVKDLGFVANKRT